MNVNFVVVNSPSLYNTIIGRITQYAIQWIASIYHILMKFPTPFGVGVFEGIQTLSTEMYPVDTSFHSKQLKYALHTFSLGSDTPPKLVEFYDWMECGTVDYAYLTGEIPLGSLDPKDDQFAQRGALVEVEFDMEKPRKTFKIGSYWSNHNSQILLSF